MAAARSAGVTTGLCVTRRGSARDAAGKDAAAEEGAFERAIAVHPAAAKATHLARRIKTAKRRAARHEDATVEIGLETAERLARQDPEADRDERTGLRIGEAMRAGDSDEAIADVATRVTYRGRSPDCG